VKSRYILSSLISLVIILLLVVAMKFLKFSDPFSVVNYFFLSFLLIICISLIIFYNCLKKCILNIIFVPLLSTFVVIKIIGLNILSFYLLISIISGIVLALFYRLDYDYDDIYFYSFSIVLPIMALLFSVFKYFLHYDIISKLNYHINSHFYEWTYQLKSLIRTGIDNSETTNYVLDIITRIRINFLENFIIISSLTFFLIIFFISITINRAYSDYADKYNVFSYLKIKSRYIGSLIIGLVFIILYFTLRKNEMLYVGKSIIYFSLTIYFIQGIAIVIFFNIEKFYNTRTLLLLLVIFIFLVWASKGLCYWLSAVLVMLYGLIDYWANFRRLDEQTLEFKNTEGIL